MPELPEVEIMCRNARRWAAGHLITRAELCDPRLAPDLRDGSVLEGHRVVAVRRRAKLACLELAPPDPGAPHSVLVLHFRMSGRLLLDDGSRRRVRLRLHLDGPHRVLVFDDPRCLGNAWLLPKAGLEAFFAARRLGPEPWPEPRDGRWWAERFRGLRGAIKPALLQQQRVAGLGNIAASEVLFAARLAPTQRVPDVPPEGWARLASAVPQFIDRVIATESGDEIHFVQHGGPNPFSVYGQEGQPCPACARPIQRTMQSGRSTFWCAGCQPELRD